MITYTVYGEDAPTIGSIALADDATDYYLTTLFYKYGGGLAGYYTLGGRVWTPVGCPPRARIMCWNDVAGIRDATVGFGAGGTDFESFLTTDVFVDTNPGGWTEGLFPSPPLLPADGLRVMIGYYFCDSSDEQVTDFVYTASMRADDDDNVVSNQGVNLTIAEWNDPGSTYGPVHSGYARTPGNIFAVGGTAGYGIDIIAWDGVPGSDEIDANATITVTLSSEVAIGPVAEIDAEAIIQLGATASSAAGGGHSIWNTTYPFDLVDSNDGNGVYVATNFYAALSNYALSGVRLWVDTGSALIGKEVTMLAFVPAISPSLLNVNDPDAAVAITLQAGWNEVAFDPVAMDTIYYQSIKSATVAYHSPSGDYASVAAAPEAVQAYDGSELFMSEDNSGYPFEPRYRSGYKYSTEYSNYLEETVFGLDIRVLEQAPQVLANGVIHLLGSASVQNPNEVSTLQSFMNVGGVWLPSSRSYLRSPGHGIPTSWPDETTTGFTAPLTPETHASYYFETPNMVVEDMDLTVDQIIVTAAGAIIRNCRITSEGYYAVRVQDGGDLLIEDCEIIGAPTGTAVVLVEGSGRINIQRCNIHGSEDGVRLGSNSILQDSYVHGLVGDDGSAHYDAVTADGKIGFQVIHNTILNEHDQTACLWIGDPRYDPGSGLVQYNYFAGGGYVLYAGPSTGTGLKVKDNVFSTQFWPDGGFFGTCASWVSANNEWSNNIWIDGPNAGELVTPH